MSRSGSRRGMARLPMRRPADLISSHVMNQDFVAWIGQGTIADRTQEHLGTSDRGVLMLRKRFLNDLEAVAKGEDPKADHSRSRGEPVRRATDR